MSEPAKEYVCTIHLTNGGNISLNTTVPEETAASICKLMNEFFERRLFQKSGSVIKLIGIPTTYIRIDQIMFFTIDEA